MELHTDQVERKDVLLGRGKHSNDWEGNVFFRKLVRKRAKDYLRARDNTTKRDEIAAEVIAEVEANGGRFIQLQKLRTASDEPTRWLVVSKATVVTKVKQALRDAAKPVRRTSSSLKRIPIRTSSHSSSQASQPWIRSDSSLSLRGCVTRHVQNNLSQMLDSESIGALDLVGIGSSKQHPLSTQKVGTSLTGVKKQWGLVYQQPGSLLPPITNSHEMRTSQPSEIDPKYNITWPVSTNYRSLLDHGQRTGHTSQGVDFYAPYSQSTSSVEASSLFDTAPPSRNDFFCTDPNFSQGNASRSDFSNTSQHLKTAPYAKNNFDLARIVDGQSLSLHHNRIQGFRRSNCSGGEAPIGSFPKVNDERNWNSAHRNFEAQSFTSDNVAWKSRSLGVCGEMSSMDIRTHPMMADVNDCCDLGTANTVVGTPQAKVANSRHSDPPPAETADAEEDDSSILTTALCLLGEEASSDEDLSLIDSPSRTRN